MAAPNTIPISVPADVNPYQPYYFRVWRRCGRGVTEIVCSHVILDPSCDRCLGGPDGTEGFSIEVVRGSLTQHWCPHTYDRTSCAICAANDRAHQRQMLRQNLLRRRAGDDDDVVEVASFIYPPMPENPEMGGGEVVMLNGWHDNTWRLPHGLPPVFGPAPPLTEFQRSARLYDRLIGRSGRLGEDPGFEIPDMRELLRSLVLLRRLLESPIQHIGVVFRETPLGRWIDSALQILGNLIPLVNDARRALSTGQFMTVDLSAFLLDTWPGLSANLPERIQS